MATNCRGKPFTAAGYRSALAEYHRSSVAVISLSRDYDRRRDVPAWGMAMDRLVRSLVNIPLPQVDAVMNMNTEG